MHYLTLSFTHKNTSIEVREKLSFSSIKALEEILKTLTSCESINEAIVLSTCNRVEIIASVNEFDKSLKYIIQKLSDHSGLSKDDLNERADVYENSSAVHHLFAVASSLDSLVVGETQIAGQLKDAFRFSFDNGYCSQKLSRIMHKAFRCAAKIREKTNISKSPISVASVAVAKAKDLLGNIGGMTAVVIGAGEMSTLVAKHLVASEVNTIILSRNEHKAKKLADELGEFASYDSLGKLKEYINRYRIFFSATSAPGAVITDSLIEHREYERYFFDIAVPRDIELSTGELIHVFAVDDLQEIVTKNMAFREEQAQVAYKTVREETMNFYKWLQDMEIEPIIKELRLKAKACAKKEIEKAKKKGYIKHSSYDEVEKIVHQVFQSFLHEPTVNLKHISERPEGDAIMQSMQYLFGISEDRSEQLNHYKCEYHMEKQI